MTYLIRSVKNLTLQRRWLLAVGAFLGLSVPLLAWGAAPSSGIPTVSAGEILRVLMGLGIVLGLLFAGLWLFKRGTGGSFRLSQHKMRIISSLPLSGRARLLLVEISGKQLLIGVNPHRIALISEFEANGAPEATSPRSDAFIYKLLTSMQGKRAAEHEDQDDGTGVDSRSDPTSS